MSDPVQCHLSNGFSLREKLYAQFSFFVMGIVGMIGIAREDWRWLVPYLVVFGYGVPGIVMRHLTCPRCPHLFVYGDCLQFPPTWAKWLVKQRKTTPFSAIERWTLGIAGPGIEPAVFPGIKGRVMKYQFCTIQD